MDDDEKWFNLVNLKRKERYHNDSPRNKVRQHKKANDNTYVCATARPSAEHKFDALISVWRIQSDYQAQRSSVNHKRGDLDKVDCKMTSDLYYKYKVDTIIPEIKNRMPFAPNFKI